MRGSPSHSVARPVDGILEDVPEPRKYQLQNERANRLIADLLDAAEVPADRRGYFQQLMTTVLKLHEDRAGTGDLKITTTALKELRVDAATPLEGEGELIGVLCVGGMRVRQAQAKRLLKLVADLTGIAFVHVAGSCSPRFVVNTTATFTPCASASKHCGALWPEWLNVRW